MKAENPISVMESIDEAIALVLLPLLILAVLVALA